MHECDVDTPPARIGLLLRDAHNTFSDAAALSSVLYNPSRHIHSRHISYEYVYEDGNGCT